MILKSLYLLQAFFLLIYYISNWYLVIILAILMEAKLINQYTIFPVGDSALTLYLGNNISVPANQKVIAMQQWLQRNQPEGIKDIIVAYSSLTIMYDPFLVKKKCKPRVTVVAFMSELL